MGRAEIRNNGLILQQLDGNIIGPKILGKTTKLQALQCCHHSRRRNVRFAGMILGVPTMAVIYVYIASINNRLNKKNLPMRTEIYEDFTKYNINKEDIFGKDSCVSFDRAEEHAEDK
ncbi:MAG: AI-2E family transporter [Anaerovoracaceae bacterium]